MYIRCKGCGRRMLLAKWWGANWQSCVGEGFNDFLNEHISCAFEKKMADCCKNQQFEIVYESQ